MGTVRMVHPEDELVYACPECNASRIRERERTDDYRCDICGAVVDEPAERESLVFADNSKSLTHDENGMVYACPECDSATPDIRKRKTPRYRCSDCGATFETARERKRKQTGRSTLEAAIAEGDVPEELLGSPFDGQ